MPPSFKIWPISFSVFNECKNVKMNTPVCSGLFQFGFTREKNFQKKGNSQLQVNAKMRVAQDKSKVMIPQLSVVYSTAHDLVPAGCPDLWCKRKLHIPAH